MRRTALICAVMCAGACGDSAAPVSDDAGAAVDLSLASPDSAADFTVTPIDLAADAGPADLTGDSAPPEPVPDLRVPDPVPDLHVPDLLLDAGAPVDAAAPDLVPVPADAGVADLAVLPAPDLPVAPGDAGPSDLALAADGTGAVDPNCRFGYLNPDAPGTCPLACGPDVSVVPAQARFHIPYCSGIPYADNPPSSGLHWPFPQPWGVHHRFVPPELWVHNLEHGGVVLLYNCPVNPNAIPPPPPNGTQCVNNIPDNPADPNTCPQEIAALEHLFAVWPARLWGDMPVVKLIVTYDPYMPKRFAAVAWGYLWASNVLDTKAIECFIQARLDAGPEWLP